jgi:copper chaperone
MNTQKFQVQGMNCNGCVKKIEGALQNIGVAGKVDLANGSVEVQYDEAKVNLDAIKEVIVEKGYKIAG